MALDGGDLKENKASLGDEGTVVTCMMFVYLICCLLSFC